MSPHPVAVLPALRSAPLRWPRAPDVVLALLQAPLGGRPAQPSLGTPVAIESLTGWWNLPSLLPARTWLAAAPIARLAARRRAGRGLVPAAAVRLLPWVDDAMGLRGAAGYRLGATGRLPVEVGTAPKDPGPPSVAGGFAAAAAALLPAAFAIAHRPLRRRLRGFVLLGFGEAPRRRGWAFTTRRSARSLGRGATRSPSWKTAARPRWVRASLSTRWAAPGSAGGSIRAGRRLGGGIASSAQRR